MGAEMWGGGSAKKAAKKQADALDKQTRLMVDQANLAAEAAASQMRNAQEQKLAQDYADKLLEAPAEAAKVSLRPEEDLSGDGDLLTRRRGVRYTYRARR